MAKPHAAGTKPFELDIGVNLRESAIDFAQSCAASDEKSRLARCLDRSDPIDQSRTVEVSKRHAESVFGGERGVSG